MQQQSSLCVYNPDTDRCVLASGKLGQQVIRMYGMDDAQLHMCEYNGASGRCRKVYTVGSRGTARSTARSTTASTPRNKAVRTSVEPFVEPYANTQYPPNSGITRRSTGLNTEDSYIAPFLRTSSGTLPESYVAPSLRFNQNMNPEPLNTSFSRLSIKSPRVISLAEEQENKEEKEGKCEDLSRLSKYRNRPSPPFPANQCCGETKRGNDGNMWRSVRNVRGICQWKPDKTSSSSSSSSSSSGSRSRPTLEDELYE